MRNILTKECDIEIANLYFQEYALDSCEYNTVYLRTQVYLFSGNQQLYLLYSN